MTAVPVHSAGMQGSAVWGWEGQDRAAQAETGVSELCTIINHICTNCSYASCCSCFTNRAIPSTKPDNHSYTPHAGWEQGDSPPSPKALSRCHCHRMHTPLPPPPSFAGHACLMALPHTLDLPPWLLAYQGWACLLLAHRRPSCPRPVMYTGALATCT